jgi:sugar phosphate permease
MSTVQNRLLISFVVAWIAYALTYFLRKPLGVVSDKIVFFNFFSSAFDSVDQN